MTRRLPLPLPGVSARTPGHSRGLTNAAQLNAGNSCWSIRIAECLLCVRPCGLWLAHQGSKSAQAWGSPWSPRGNPAFLSRLLGGDLSTGPVVIRSQLGGRRQGPQEAQRPRGGREVTPELGPVVIRSQLGQSWGEAGRGPRRLRGPEVATCRGRQAVSEPVMDRAWRSKS